MSASPDLHTGIAQQDLKSTISDRPDLLRQVPWRQRTDALGRPTGLKGIADARGYERTALVNDLSRHGIPVQLRLDVAHLRALTGDETQDELIVRGPNRMSWAMPQEALPDEPYTITGAWQDFPAFFADWLNYAAFERPDLGAEYAKMVWRKVIEEGGVPVWKQEPVTVPARPLFQWRTRAELADGERPSGLVVPNISARLMTDDPLPPEAREALEAAEALATAEAEAAAPKSRRR